jgi:HD-like signal output (HDOD) protein
MPLPVNAPPTPSLDRLWARMNERSAFPMLSDTLRATMAVLKSDDLDYRALARIILSDVALTQKLLRLANSAMYAAFGGNITTVTRALTVLGIDTVAHLVIGSKLLEHFEQNADMHADAKLALNRALLSGAVTRKLTAHVNLLAGEEALVCTLMRQVGKLLVVCYLAPEWQEIRLDIARGIDEEEACIGRLGADFETIGLDAARRWHLPSLILGGMMHYDPAAHAVAVYPTQPADDADAQPGQLQWLRAVSHCATEMADALVSETPGKSSLTSLAQRFGGVLRFGPEHLSEIATALMREPASEAVRREIVTLRALSLTRARGTREAELSAELNAVRALPASCPLESVLEHVAEAMLNGLGLSRVLGFMGDGGTGFAARFGRGVSLPASFDDLRFAQAFEADVFHLAIGNTLGIFIEDAQSPKMIERVPAWYRVTLGDARAYLLLPVHAHGAPVALLYGDWTGTQPAQKFRTEEMHLLNALAAEMGRFEVNPDAA